MSRRRRNFRNLPAPVSVRYNSNGTRTRVTGDYARALSMGGSGGQSH